jgi:hypothetical protein
MSETFYEVTSDGWQMRSRLPIRAALTLEDVASDIRRLFDWWRSSRSAAREIPATAHFLDVRPGNPFDYVFYNHGGKVFGDLSGIRFHQYPITAHARACASEYLACKGEASAMAHHIEQHFDGVDREYLRLMCPLFDARGRVASIVYAYRHLQQPLSRPVRP